MAAGQLQEKLSSTPVYCALLDESSDPCTLLGSCNIDLGRACSRLRTGSTSSGSIAVQERCTLANVLGSRLGTMTVRYRIAEISFSVDCHLEIAQATPQSASAPAAASALPRTSRPVLRQQNALSDPGIPGSLVNSAAQVDPLHAAHTGSRQDAPLHTPPPDGSTTDTSCISTSAKATAYSDQHQRGLNHAAAEPAPPSSPCEQASLDTATAKQVSRSTRTAQHDQSQVADEASTSIMMTEEVAGMAASAPDDCTSTSNSPAASTVASHNPQQLSRGRQVGEEQEERYETNTLCPPPMIYTAPPRSAKPQSQQYQPNMQESQTSSHCRAESRAPDSFATEQSEQNWQLLARRIANNHPINTRLTVTEDERHDSKMEPEPHLSVLMPQPIQPVSVSETQESSIVAHRTHAPLSAVALMADTPTPLLQALLGELEAVLGRSDLPAGIPAQVPTNIGHSMKHSSAVRHAPAGSTGPAWFRRPAGKDRSQPDRDVPLTNTIAEEQNTADLAQAILNHLLENKQERSPDSAAENEAPALITPEVPPDAPGDPVTQRQESSSNSSSSSLSSTTFIPVGSTHSSPRHPIIKHLSSRSRTMPSLTTDPDPEQSSPEEVSARRKKVLRKRSSGRLSSMLAPALAKDGKVQVAKATMEATTEDSADLCHAPVNRKQSRSEQQDIPSAVPPALRSIANADLTNVSDSSTCLPKVLVFLPSHTETGGSGASGEGNARKPSSSQPATAAAGKDSQSQRKAKMKRRKSLLAQWPIIASAMSADSDISAVIATKKPPRSPLGDDASAKPAELNTDAASCKSSHGTHTSSMSDLATSELSSMQANTDGRRVSSPRKSGRLSQPHIESGLRGQSDHLDSEQGKSAHRATHNTGSSDAEISSLPLSSRQASRASSPRKSGSDSFAASNTRYTDDAFEDGADTSEDTARRTAITSNHGNSSRSSSAGSCRSPPQPVQIMTVDALEQACSSPDQRRTSVQQQYSTSYDVDTDDIIFTESDED
ncbi:uncharacterized protein LOC135806179 [Sycon ciliatum]|uniref:uncharacterized protein LOC135806179 n=1 Tax=Sycon ciliatum TaxID=27933 RepID=UPI0031F6DFC3